jgi:hypothetical protein
LMLFTLFLLWFMISSFYLCYLDLPNKVLTLLLGALSLYYTQCSLTLLLNALLLIGSPFMFCYHFSSSCLCIGVGCFWF